jgi:hypothetical protein
MLSFRPARKNWVVLCIAGAGNWHGSTCSGQGLSRPACVLHWSTLTTTMHRKEMGYQHG